MEKLKDLKSELNAFSCEENLWPLYHQQTPETKTFTWNTSSTLGILERYQRLLQAWDKRVEWWDTVGQKGVDREWFLQWFLRGWQISTPGKWMWNEAITCLRSIWLDATCSHFDSIALFLVSFFCLWSKMVKIVKKISCTSHLLGLLGLLDSLDFLVPPNHPLLGSSDSSWGMLSPTWIWSNPLRFGRPQAAGESGQKKAGKGDFSWDKKSEGYQGWILKNQKFWTEKIHGEIKTKPSTTHAQFWWFLFWLAK